MSLESQVRAGLVSLVAFLELLGQWNRVYNLTAASRASEMVGRHLLDSLSVAFAVHGERTLDVGSGAGLPGVPLAIMLPGRRFVLLDASAKRTRFLSQAKLQLGLENVTVVQDRIQDYDPLFSFDTIISRAFSSLHEFVDTAGRLCAPGGRLLAMKGRRRDTELRSLPPGYRLEEVRRIVVPGENGLRHLITVVPIENPAP